MLPVEEDEPLCQTVVILFAVNRWRAAGEL